MTHKEVSGERIFQPCFIIYPVMRLISPDPMTELGLFITDVKY